MIVALTLTLTLDVVNNFLGSQSKRIFEVILDAVYLYKKKKNNKIYLDFL